MPRRARWLCVCKCANGHENRDNDDNPANPATLSDHWNLSNLSNHWNLSEPRRTSSNRFVD
jgi:hypothetical protein